MTAYLGRAAFSHGLATRTGVLLINLGTPDAPDTTSVRRYLAEFLSDPRVVELPRLLWLPLLHGVILNTRPRRSAHAYQKIWGENGSPLMTGSLKLCSALQSNLDSTEQNLLLALGMRYGNPSVETALQRLIDAECRQILVLPLYPQYASATTGSAFDAVFAQCQRLRWVPELRLVSGYHAAPAYIQALAESVRRYWAANGRGERLLLSFHGIPQDTFLAGDPYFCQCQATARLLAESLELAPNEIFVTFQSRVGPKRWLEPYTDKTLDAWGSEKVGDIDVLCPGFSIDCLETLEEIAMQNAERFAAAGGGKLRYIPALNDQAGHVDALAGIIRTHLSGWHSDSSGADETVRQRAMQAGAAR